MSTVETALTKQEPKQELTKTEPQSAKATRLAAFTPGNLTEAIALSKLMASSDMVPKDYKGKAANILLAMQFGSEVGLAPLQALQSIAVINGRPCLWGDGALALVMAHPDFEDIQETTEGTVAKCVIRRKGRSPVIRTFSDADATKAGLLNKEGPWRSYRERMRSLRARGFALRDSFADALKGISIAEEAMDMPIDTSPAKTRRDTGAIDVADAVSALIPSTEPNRGHTDTGLQRNPEKKTEDVMCGRCGKVNGHEESCPDYIKALQDAKTSKPTKEVAVKIDDMVRKAGKKKRTPYLLLTVTDADNLTWELYAWHFHDHLQDAKGKMMICEYSEKQADGRTYCSLEHIHNLGGVQFVNDSPAQQGTLIPEDEHWDVG